MALALGLRQEEALGAALGVVPAVGRGPCPVAELHKVEPLAVLAPALAEPAHRDVVPVGVAEPGGELVKGLVDHVVVEEEIGQGLARGGVAAFGQRHRVVGVDREGVGTTPGEGKEVATDELGEHGAHEVLFVVGGDATETEKGAGGCDGVVHEEFGVTGGTAVDVVETAPVAGEGGGAHGERGGGWG